MLPVGENEEVKDFRVVQLVPELAISRQTRISKRCFDVIFSIAVMSFGSPVFFLLYLITKFSSKGPAFFKQERLGKDGRPFIMYKFRSMCVDAEKFGPQLSSQVDPRITRWGKVIRRTRLDETPQFWNVLKGDMSIVGPRPERLHFARKIAARNPNYKRLAHIKPGITSIGQVYYGYAENVDQMCDRLKFDLLYLQKISVNADLEIIYKTVRVMLQGKGK
jgi:lipopolysaccharide/colanic/teichoic acid biosynthesis glycosyltransferase